MDNIFAALFELQLTKLKDEVNSFKDEANLWKKLDGISNAAGTLVNHLTGSLNFSVGVNIAHNGYVRNRDAEFTDTGIPREKLISGIDSLIIVVRAALENISEEELEKQYPMEHQGIHNTRFYLTYFYGHLTYHLGQINYLRRILEA
ncbi:DUF1572 domain-containing protein [Mucilaginibacter sp. X4EP1]|uniref:DUF1572 domain-containing protein n=1 Tax=Mucilaginibacter sp. X4EP1 TaxID=2723092 RepID=UPI002169F899|nr:DUF1572 domain-containing protein [Mucilaginibacter sp. X4EP1]MCS3815242.1 hypothetical protein [Mucilaginibacter sp. X4EP1]